MSMLSNMFMFFYVLTNTCYPASLISILLTLTLNSMLLVFFSLFYYNGMLRSSIRFFSKNSSMKLYFMIRFIFIRIVLKILAFS